MKRGQNKLAAGPTKTPTPSTVLCPYIRGYWGCTLAYGHAGPHVNKILGAKDVAKSPSP